MKRSLVILAAAIAAAIALTGVLTTSSNAQPSHRPVTIRFTLVRVPNSGFFPHGQPKPGERFGSLQTVRGDDGSRGRAEVLCTFFTPDTQFCNVQFTLSTGTLSLQGIAHKVNKNAPFTVIGGTGAYAVARGSAAVNDVNPTTTEFSVEFPRPDEQFQGA